jgi:hypothetical protein
MMGRIQLFIVGELFERNGFYDAQYTVLFTGGGEAQSCD